MENVNYLKRYVKERPLNSNTSYRNNLIERLDKFYKTLLKDADDYKKLAKAVTDNGHYYDGGHFMASGLAVKFRATFIEELTSSKLPAELLLDT